jgi:hypothetical protein
MWLLRYLFRPVADIRRAEKRAGLIAPSRIELFLHPSRAIRRNAIRYGIQGSSTVWKYVAVAIFIPKLVERFFGKTSDDLGIRTIGVGHIIAIAVSKPLTRKERKRQGISRASLRDEATADLQAAQRTS